MNYASKLNLSPADRIVTSLFQTGLTKHHAIYLGADVYGIEWMAENDFTAGVQIVTAGDFFQRHPLVDRVEKFQGNAFQRNQVIITAQQLAGKPYDLFSYNCEHYANEVLKGKVESNQVRNFWLALGISAFVYALAKD